jgi:hypothetical protein
MVDQCIDVVLAAGGYAKYLGFYKSSTAKHLMSTDMKSTLFQPVTQYEVWLHAEQANTGIILEPHPPVPRDRES